MRKIFSLLILVFIVLSLFSFASCQNKKPKETIKNTAYIEMVQEKNSALIKEKVIYNMKENKDEINFLLPQNMYGELNKAKTNILGIEIMSVKQNEKYLPFSILNKSQSVLNVKLDETNIGEVVELEMEYRLKLKSMDCLYQLSVLPCINQENVDFEYSNFEPLVFNEPFDIYFNINSDNYSLSFEKENNLYKIENAVDFCLVNAKTFKKQELTEGNRKIEYYYKNDAFPSETLALIKRLFKFLDDKLYKKEESVFSVYEGEISECFSNAVMVDFNQTRESYLNNLMRLIIGRYFKKVLLTDSINEPYFAGGLTEYVLVSFLSETDEAFDKMVSICKNNLVNFEKNAIKMDYPFKIDNRRNASSYLNDYDYMYNVFTKSFLDLLEQFKMDKNEFLLERLKLFFESNKYKSVSYKEFLRQMGTQK